MAENTSIEWADHTFNPWIGCTKVSPGCDHCYAKADFDDRKHRVTWGAGQPRSRTSAQNWKLPLRWNKQAAILQHAWQLGVELHGGNEAACIAAGFTKPSRPKVFCASLADVFDNAVPVQWRNDLFRLISETPHLDWLLLTKRIGNVVPMLDDALLQEPRLSAGACRAASWPWPNVWLGITVVNQAEADRDIPKLLAIPAAKRFLSMEPLLGAVDLTRWLELGGLDTDYGLSNQGLDWVIVGGESGPNARPMHPDWARSLRDQCQAAGVPLLFKQWGQFAQIAWFDGPDAEADNGDDFFDADRTDHVFLASDGRTWDTKGGQWMYPPLPLGHWCLMGSIGKKAAGRALDGRTWDEVPS